MKLELIQIVSFDNGFRDLKQIELDGTGHVCSLMFEVMGDLGFGDWTSSELQDRGFGSVLVLLILCWGRMGKYQWFGKPSVLRI